jgi:DNA invertase Pin-like site-specific DNA recombinase
MVQINGLKDYIVNLYGSHKACHEALEVNRSTLYRWLNNEPRRMLRYCDRIAKQTDTTKLQLEGEILYLDEQLNE